MGKVDVHHTEKMKIWWNIIKMSSAHQYGHAKTASLHWEHDNHLNSDYCKLQHYLNKIKYRWAIGWIKHEIEPA